MLYAENKSVLRQVLSDIKSNKAELIELSKSGFMYRVIIEDDLYLAVTDISHTKITDIIPDNPDIIPTKRKYTDIYYIKYLFKQYKRHLFDTYHIKARQLSCKYCKSKHVLFNLRDFTVHCLDCNKIINLTDYGDVALKLYDMELKEPVKQCIQLSYELHAMLYSMNTEVTLNIKDNPCTIKAYDKDLFIIMYGNQSVKANKTDWLAVTSAYNPMIISSEVMNEQYSIRETSDNEEGLIT